MRIQWWPRLIVIFAIGLRGVSVGCDGESDDESVAGDDEGLYEVVTTTTMLADLVSVLGGEHVEVYSLVGIGADPHVYQPRPSDARRIASSDAVVINGLMLEGWIEDLVHNAGGERPVIVGGEAIDEENLLRVEGAIDPHVWFDVEKWRAVSAHVAEELQALMEDRGDEGALEYIAAQQEAYDEELERLHAWVEAMVASIPESQRVLVTSHDAFNYFGEAYNIEVTAIQGLSTEQEASQRDVANIVDVVRDRGASAVFTETSVNPRLIEQVAREAGVEVDGPLYSDSVGPRDSGAHSYVGMVESNVRMIVEGLSGDFREFADE